MFYHIHSHTCLTCIVAKALIIIYNLSFTVKPSVNVNKLFIKHIKTNVY